MQFKLLYCFCQLQERCDALRLALRHAVACLSKQESVQLLCLRSMDDAGDSGGIGMEPTFFMFGFALCNFPEASALMEYVQLDTEADLEGALLLMQPRGLINFVMDVEVALRCAQHAMIRRWELKWARYKPELVAVDGRRQVALR